jgi:UDPglucose--hexose-1-phosphate uridylyltransferase
MSELRKEPLSGDWIILAPGRNARPRFLDQKKPARKPLPKSTCPFEHLEKSDQWPPILSYPNQKHWKLIVVPNKYPALQEDRHICAVSLRHGIYETKSGVGTHDLLISRDHNKNFADLSPALAIELLKMLQERHRMMAKDPCSAYVSSFFNWGPGAGASVWHPHYQTLTLPIVPPQVARSLRGAEEYFARNRRCLRCDIIRLEQKEKVRIIEENAHAIAIAPYASRSPFEVSILPKKHFSHFGTTPVAVTRAIAPMLQSVMRRMKKYLNDPDLNFFIHGAPLRVTSDKGQVTLLRRGYGGQAKKLQESHHWHIEIVPKISVKAGFEFSTGIDINIVDPDRATEILRGKS